MKPVILLQNAKFRVSFNPEGEGQLFIESYRGTNKMQEPIWKLPEFEERIKALKTVLAKKVKCEERCKILQKFGVSSRIVYNKDGRNEDRIAVEFYGGKDALGQEIWDDTASTVASELKTLERYLISLVKEELGGQEA